MITVAVVNSKGGVGKTTLTSALAVRAAKDSPRVAMVDMDPQKPLVAWWKRRGKTDNPIIFEGAVTAGDAVEALTLDGWDYCFLDGPPAFLTLLQEMIQAADFTLIPVKASMVDLLATQDAVSLARDAHAAFMCAFNDVGSRERVAEKARELLLNAEVPIAKSEVVHRISHVQAMTVGKSAAEVNSGKDSAASAEIDALWKEIKEAATKAARAKARKKAAAHG